MQRRRYYRNITSDYESLAIDKGEIYIDIQEIVDKKRGFTNTERKRAVEYLMWYTCCYRKEQLDKLSDELIAKMVQDTRKLTNKESK
ncbi:hypothetical protein R9X47_12535 [Wukongibacter baidiensis]|uniref:hypothetical protein n=1 Tax=Wukongibacter baidiensis TaxID=1723361 RepID=UPI003D7FB6F2